MPEASSRPAPARLARLPEAGGDSLSVVGEVMRIGLGNLLVLPVVAPVGRSRGRRYGLAVGDEPPRPRVILSVGGRAAVVPPPHVCAVGERISVLIAAPRPAHDRPVPNDLAERLRREGLTLAALPSPKRQQVLVMLSEAASPQVRAARLDAAVEAMRATSRQERS